jgi:hypothetical protein
LNDVTSQKTVLTNQPVNAYAVSIDGMLISVSAPKGTGVKAYSVPHGTLRFTSTNATDLAFEGFGGAIGYASPRSVFGDGVHDVPVADLKNVLLKLAKVKDTVSYNPAFDPSDPNMSYAYRYGRKFTADAIADPRFAPYIINTGLNYPYQDFTKSVPLSAWDVTDPANPKRLAVGFLENNVAGGLVDGKWWPGSYQLYNNTAASGPREWLWIFNSPYTETPVPGLELEPITNPVPIMYFLTVNRDGPVPFSPDSTGEDQFMIFSTFRQMNLDTAYFTASFPGFAVPSANVKKMNGNNISAWEYNNGSCDIDPFGNAGFFYPRGTQNSVVFESGFVWGGLVSGDPQPRVGGSSYRSGLQPGRIVSTGVAENPSLEKNRLYKVRSDYASADLAEEISDEWIPKQAIEDSYANDWNEWPANDGAPFVDINKNGIYDPTIDIPGVKGATQTMWYVANDLNPVLTTYMYGSQPIGIEMQATYWNYNIAGPLNNALFKKYVIINKSAVRVDSVYLTMWCDADIGNASDDFVGTDTARRMVYTYNANPFDAICGALPPAVGYAYLQTPTVASASDSAYFGNRWIKGKRNIPVNASYYFTNGDATVYDPVMGSITGSTQFYNFMRGRIGASGQIYSDPSGVGTYFPLSGDPVTNNGWVDGILFPMADRRMGISSGPISFAPGDTQEVVFAEIAADASPATGSLTAIVNLRKNCDSIRAEYYSLANMSTGIKDKNSLARKFALSQNYPNPFNPVTVIRFELPAKGKVTLRVYDMLGREVALLINEEKPAGVSQVEFNASRLASGVYIYKLDCNDFSSIKKMMLLK